MTDFNSIVFCNGDETAARAAAMVHEMLFSSLPVISVPVDVGSRLRTNDQCLYDAVAALREHGAGIKISTATDGRIKEAGLKSANIVMRGLVNSSCMIRVTQAPGRYKNPVGVIRLGDGDIYSMTDSKIALGENGVERIEYVTQMRLDILPHAAQIALEVAKEHGLRLKLFTKDTIRGQLPKGQPVPDAVIRERVTAVWHDAGLTLGGDGNQGYDFALTDIGMGKMALTNAGDGGFLVVLGNALGDIGSDLLDFEHGGYTMSSIVVSMEGFRYEELALGTAPDLLETDLTGQHFYNPLSIVLGFCSAIERANPELTEWLGIVRTAAMDYIDITPAADCGTEAMIDYIANAAGKPRLLDAA